MRQIPLRHHWGNCQMRAEFSRAKRTVFGHKHKWDAHGNTQKCSRMGHTATNESMHHRGERLTLIKADCYRWLMLGVDNNECLTLSALQAPLLSLHCCTQRGSKPGTAQCEKCKPEWQSQENIFLLDIVIVLPTFSLEPRKQFLRQQHRFPHFLLSVPTTAV